ncbi:MAG: hypothetical protein J6R04_07605 [Clostridia bacterium]|nr:hypothetical protein [Clostridia bacterium]
MAPLTVIGDAEFKKQITSAPALGYLLFGEEDYLKSFALRQARETLCGNPTFACFNELQLDAIDHTPEALREALRGALMPLPMMAERKVVLLRGLDFTSMKQTDIDALCDVLAELADYDYNTLLIPVASGAIDETYQPKKNRASKHLTQLGKYLTLVQFERCTPAKLSGWCIRHFEHNGAVASPALCQTLIETCGRDMMTLASEIDKISFYALSHGRREVTVDDIVTAASTTVEFDTFAFTNALTERNTAGALAVLADMKFRRVDPLFALSEVIRTACDMLSVLMLATEGKTNAEISRAMNGLHEFVVGRYRKSATTAGEAALRRMIAACREADRALKLSPQGYLALEQLICSL